MHRAVWGRPGGKVITFVADCWLDGWVEWVCNVNRLDYHGKVFPSDSEMMATAPLDDAKRLLSDAGL